MSISRLTKKQLINIIDNQNKKIKELEDKCGEAKFVDCVVDNILVEPLCIVGVGTLKTKGDIKITKVSLDILKKTINVFENFNKIAGGRAENIYIGVSNDFPLLIGNYEEDNDKFKGFVIAPRVD